MRDESSMSDWAKSLRDWRRANGVKQGVLANMLGVSQSSVSRWERAIDQPSAATSVKIRNIVHRGIVNQLAQQQAITERLPGLAALVDLDGMRLLATSHEFKAVWSEAVKAEGQLFAEHLTELTRELFYDDAFMQAVRHNEIAMVTGVSNRHVNGFGENAFRHHWSAIYKQNGTRHYAEMLFEPCEPEAELGIRDILRVDEIK